MIDADGRNGASGRRGYVICSEPRSGSAFLCELLESTLCLGRPTEYLGPGRMRGALRRDPAALETLFERASTPNGIYGLKIFTQHFDASAGTGWPAAFPGLSHILLTRRDLLAQAISLVRALQTNQFSLLEPSYGEPRYDRRAIAQKLRRLAHNYARWEAYFARNGIAPLRLYYEDIVASPSAGVTAVAGLLGIDAPVGALRAKSIVQRDELSEQWRRRFLDDAADRSYLDEWPFGTMRRRLRAFREGSD